jgi:hypothetical protein
LGLYDRFELLELRRDDGIQTYHAREIATARPVQVHLIVHGETAENLALLSRIEHLPDAEWRRVIERGEVQGMPYVVTDRLAGHPGFREWLTMKTDPAPRTTSLDRQFYELFDPNMDTAAITIVPRSTTPAASPAPVAWPLPGAANADPSQDSGIHRTPGRSLVAIGFGILAAIALLALIIAVIAFRRK